MDIAKRAAEIYAEYGTIKQTARIIGVSPQTVKRLLISQGVYSTPLTQRVEALRALGKTDAQIAGEMGISVKWVIANTPYTRGTYKGEKKTLNAQHIAACRQRKAENQK